MINTLHVNTLSRRRLTLMLRSFGETILLNCVLELNVQINMQDPEWSPVKGLLISPVVLLIL